MQPSGRLKRILASALPQSWLIMRGRVRENILALTFDDGPHPRFTAEVLDLLGLHNMRATFFFIGENVERHPDLVRRVVAEGHQLGNHSYRHNEFSRTGLLAQLAEVDRMDHLLSEFDGARRHPFRPPRGELPIGLLAALVSRRQRVAMWSYDSLDYQGLGAPSILARFAARDLSRGDVVLMHDDNAETVAALRELLPGWRAHGWTGVTLSELEGG